MEPPVLQGRPPSATQENTATAAVEHWRKVGNEAPVQALARVEEAAKQLVSLTGTLQGWPTKRLSVRPVRAHPRCHQLRWVIEGY